MDAAECAACLRIWSDFKKQREKEMSLLLRELEAHIDAGELEFE
jgi:hypothetical protein